MSLDDTHGSATREIMMKIHEKPAGEWRLNRRHHDQPDPVLVWGSFVIGVIALALLVICVGHELFLRLSH